MSVGPYQEITFDADGDVDTAQRARLAGLDVTDLVMFAHGWNNSVSVASRLYSAFFAPFPGLLASSPGVRLGYAGVVWPSMKFTDEPIPDFRPSAAAHETPGLDRETQHALAELFPGHRGTVARLTRLLDEQPESEAAFAEFGVLARQLAEVPAGGLEASFSDDLPLDEQGPPAVLYEDTLTMCRKFTLALEETGAVTKEEPAAWSFSFGGGLKRLWKGAKELLRQTTYYAMKRRAGTVGELGLGPLLGQLARSSPQVRVHLVGHSQGARLVAFALRGLPDGAGNVKSVTLLQGAFSHYAFSSNLPHAPHRGGALRSMQHRVDGPVVACYSRHDSALGVIYPLASSLAGDSSTAAGDDRRWWAMGHDGIQAVERTARLTLEEALRAGIPSSGCVSVDTASVVRRGGPPSGAHSDICHAELARVVLAAGRIGR
ncbi:serine-threonine protein kinase [Streptomyces sp. NBC_01142]|uniref:serine-threonine protein kinase n=1 Tax=Streptomyces sp. NBC_01142 TaxID=2975865 RepID=UPI002256EDC9|nr:serine-threonine protein kinase [Streptomyces sp. NBC_01142]MCX4822007.1 serine-threonine protein kinase [Streptomyces sp. NBC_01142]